MAKANKSKKMPSTLAVWIKGLRKLQEGAGVGKKTNGGGKNAGDQLTPPSARPHLNPAKGSPDADYEILLNIAQSNWDGESSGGAYCLPLTGLVLCLVVPEDGMVEVGCSSPLLHVLHDADARRIRLCAVCRKIFYAKREGSRACEGKCLVTYRARRWRARKHREKGGGDSDKILKGVFRRAGADRSRDPERPKRKRIARPTGGTGKLAGKNLKWLKDKRWRLENKGGG